MISPIHFAMSGLSAPPYTASEINSLLSRFPKIQLHKQLQPLIKGFNSWAMFFIESNHFMHSFDLKFK